MRSNPAIFISSHHSVNQQVFVEQVLYARHCFRLWCTVVNEADKFPPLMELTFK